MNGNPSLRGVANKGEKSQIYAYPQYIVSKDANDNEMRCGRLDSYFQVASGAWGAMTTAQLFKKSWTPNEFSDKWMDKNLPGSGGFDTKESIIGKKCYVGLWQGSERVDKTSDTSIMKFGDEIGTVVAEQGVMAIIHVNPAFTARHEFLTEGRWCEIADPSEVKPGDNCYIERPRTATQQPPRTEPATTAVDIPQAVLDRYPLADIEQFTDLARKHAPELLAELPTGDELKKFRLNLRYMNPVCENPGCDKPKNEVKAYILCECCRIVMYCSSKCKGENAVLHKEWADLLPHSPPPAYNPQAPMIIELNEDKNRANAAYKYDENNTEVEWKRSI